MAIPYATPPPPYYVVEHPDEERARTERDVEVAPMVGFELGGRVDTAGGSYDIRDSPTYGVMLGVRVSPYVRVQLGYRMQGTELDSNVAFYPKYRVLDLTVHHLQAGADVDVYRSGGLRLYGGAFVGLTDFSPHADLNDDVRFSAGLQAGAVYMAGPNFGVRAQGRATTAFVRSGSAVFCSSPGGCSFGVFGSGIGQWDVAIGPVVAF